MYLPSLMAHAAELYRIIVKSPHPSDSIASEYLRSKKYIGSKERKFISAATFASLRCKLTAEHLVNFANDTISINDAAKIPIELGAIIATALIGEKFCVWKPELLLFPAAFDSEATLPLSTHCRNALEKRCEISQQTAEIWIQNILVQAEVLLCRLSSSINISSEISNAVSMPEWILHHWSESIGYESTIRRAQVLLAPAPICLRVNTLAITRDNAARELERLGISTIYSKISPDCLILEDRVNITQNPLFLNGGIEIQDEGSQIIAYAAAPREGDEILDACAGAGGKSLHIAALQRNRGIIICSDSNPRRLRPILSRAKRAGADSISINSNFSSEKIHPKQFDIVIVDAPCSGMGIVRRSPTIKWRLSPSSLRKIALKQKDILHKYSLYVCPGGILVYATCSLMQEENEAVCEDFLAKHNDFIPDNLDLVFRQNGIVNLDLPANSYYCTLSPEQYGSDGFFMARFVRIEHK